MKSNPRVKINRISFQRQFNPKEKRISFVENRGGARIRDSTLRLGLIL